MIARLALWSALTVTPLATAAQTAPAQPQGPAPMTAPVAPAACCLIPAGTVVEIVVDDPIDSKTAVIGAHFAIHLNTPLQLTDGNFVIAAGTRGVGEIVHAAKARMGGKAGELIIAARYLDVNGVQVPLRGLHLGGQGKDNSGLANAAVISIGIAGMLISGGEKRVPSGSIATAKIADDTTLPPLPAAGAATIPPAASTTIAVGTPPAAGTTAANTRESHK